MGYIIKQLRESAGLTQAELSEKIGINVNTLATYERETREPNIEKIGIFAEFFGVTADYLLGRSPFQNDIDANAAREQANDIAILLSRITPEVRGNFLAALERLLLKCGDGVSDSSKTILNRLASVVDRLGEVKCAFSEWVGDAAVLDNSESDTLMYVVANGVTTDTFKAALADSCSSMREEIDGLYKDLPLIFEQESRQAVQVARSNAQKGTAPRHSGEGGAG